jgi:hypothetical protein
MGIFAIVSHKANYKMLLAKNLEVLYLVDNNEMKKSNNLKRSGIKMSNSDMA